MTEAAMLQRFFKLAENKTTVKTEVLSGATTFMTMSYIIFVQPIVLSIAGMDIGSVMVATCVSSAIGTILMGLLANYPIALAPAMGHNFFFAITVVTILAVPWQVALGATFIAGVIFLIISLFGMREAIINSVPDSLKNAIAVGIGLLIALVGFEWGGIVVAAPGTLMTIGKMTSPPVLLCLFGLAVMAILSALKIRGAIIIGIVAGAFAGLPFGLTSYHGIFAAPPSLKPTFLALDIKGALSVGMISVIFIFLFLALFDTVGTLIGVSQKAGFIGPDGKLPRARRALVADSLSIVFGAALGTSTVTSYIESATGVSEGGRTGLSNMVTALLLLAALFISPLVMMIGAGYKLSDTVTLYPAIAPALIFVGSLMLTLVNKINWENVAEAFPAFLTIIFMPLTVSITEGISVGFISWTLLALVTRRMKREHIILYIFAILFVLRYVFLTY
jgi:AGZA family xanthine/uracil permease-like MFS transporter